MAARKRCVELFDFFCLLRIGTGGWNKHRRSVEEPMRRGVICQGPRGSKVKLKVGFLGLSEQEAKPVNRTS